MKDLLTIINDDGRHFNVRIVVNGARYGRKDDLLHLEDDPLIEFFDATYAGPEFGPRGQFVSRYYLSTLQKRRDGSALCLEGGVPLWHVSTANVAEAIRHAVAAINKPLGKARVTEVY